MRNAELFRAGFAGPAIALTIGLSSAPRADAGRGGPIEVTVVADENTPQPETPGFVFNNFTQIPMGHYGGRSVFFGSGGPPFAGTHGAYGTSDHGLVRIIDTTEALPGLGLPYSSIFGLSGDDSHLVIGARAPTVIDGIIVFSSNGPELLLDSTVVRPGSSESFDSLWSPRLQAETVVFGGSGQTSSSGIYKIPLAGGAAEKVLDQSDTLPGQESPASILHGVGGFSDGGIVFYGFSDRVGVYVTDLNGNVTRIVDTDTPQPNSPNEFSYFAAGYPVIDGHTVAFAAGSGGPNRVSGVYMAPSDGSGPLITITDTTMPLPGGLEDQTVRFGSPSIHNGNVAFVGVDVSGFGNAVYLFHEGIVQQVIARGDEIGGRTVDLFDVSVDGLEGDSLVFWTRFTDGTEGILLATIPAPPAVLLLAPFAGAVLRRRRGYAPAPRASAAPAGAAARWRPRSSSSSPTPSSADSWARSSPASNARACRSSAAR